MHLKQEIESYLRQNSRLACHSKTNMDQDKFQPLTSHTVLFQLIFTFIYSTFNKKFSISKISGSQTNPREINHLPLLLIGPLLAPKFMSLPTIYYSSNLIIDCKSALKVGVDCNSHISSNISFQLLCLKYKGITQIFNFFNFLVLTLGLLNMLKKKTMMY